MSGTNEKQNVPDTPVQEEQGDEYIDTEDDEDDLGEAQHQNYDDQAIPQPSVQSNPEQEQLEDEFGDLGGAQHQSNDDQAITQSHNSNLDHVAKNIDSVDNLDQIEPDTPDQEQLDDDEYLDAEDDDQGLNIDQVDIEEKAIPRNSLLDLLENAENQSVPRCKYCPHTDNLVAVCECKGGPNRICIDCYHRMVDIGDPRIYPDQSVPTCYQCREPYRIFLPRCKQCDRLDKNLVAKCQCTSQQGQNICQECYLELVTEHSPRIYPNHKEWPTCPDCVQRYNLSRPICRRCNLFDNLNRVCDCTGDFTYTCDKCYHDCKLPSCPVCGVNFRTNAVQAIPQPPVIPNDDQEQSDDELADTQIENQNVLDTTMTDVDQGATQSTGTTIGSIIVVLIALMIILTLLFWFVPIVNKRHQVAIKYLWIVLMFLLGVLLVVIILVKTYVDYNRREGPPLDRYPGVIH